MNRLSLCAGILSGLILAVALCGEAAASDVRLESPLAGLRLMIRGPLTVSGETPLEIEDLPAGRYRLRFDGWGVSTGRASITMGRDGTIESGRLHGAGSLLMPPGVAALEGGFKARGLLLLGMGSGGLVGAILKEKDRLTARDDYKRALDAYDRATSPEEARRQRLRALSTHDLEQDEAEVRTLWGIYFGSLWIGSALEAWLLTPSASFDRSGDGTYQVEVPSASGAFAGLRSALVPGAGQRALGHEGRGNRFMLAVGVLGAASILSHDSFLDARRDQRDYQRRYDAATSDEEISRLSRDLRKASDRADDWNWVRWSLVALTGGMHLWNIVDAVGLGQSESKPGSVKLSVIPAKAGLELGLVWGVS